MGAQGYQRSLLFEPGVGSKYERALHAAPADMTSNYTRLVYPMSAFPIQSSSLLFLSLLVAYYRYTIPNALLIDQ